MKYEMFNYNFERDFGHVHRLFTDLEVSNLISARIGHKDVKSFGSWLQDELTRSINDFMCFYNGNEFVGFVYSYDFMISDGHTAMATAVTKSYRDTGAGAVIAMQFVRFLFDNYALRKIYFRVYDFNINSANLVLKFGAIEESILKEFRYHKGKYHDLRIFSLSRESFFSNKLVEYMERKEGAKTNEKN